MNVWLEYAKRKPLKAEQAQYGFDLTQFQPDGFMHVLSGAGIHFEPRREDREGISGHVYSKYYWTGPGVAIVTEHNPITGEGHSLNFAGYIGVFGEPGRVREVVKLIKQNAEYIKDESPGRLDFIDSRKHEALQIRASNYRGQQGFTVSGRPSAADVMGIKIFTKTREGAEKIRDLYKDPSLSDEQRFDMVNQILLRGEGLKHEDRELIDIGQQVSTAGGRYGEIVDLASVYGDQNFVGIRWFDTDEEEDVPRTSLELDDSTLPDDISFILVREALKREANPMEAVVHGPDDVGTRVDTPSGEGEIASVLMRGSEVTQVHVDLDDGGSESFDPSEVETLGPGILEALANEVTPPDIETLAREVRDVYDRAAKDLGADLSGFSVLDLMADQFPTLPLSTLEDAIVVAGLGRLYKKRGESLKHEHVLEVLPDESELAGRLIASSPLTIGLVEPSRNPPSRMVYYLDGSEDDMSDLIDKMYEAGIEPHYAEVTAPMEESLKHEQLHIGDRVKFDPSSGLETRVPAGVGGTIVGGPVDYGEGPLWEVNWDDEPGWTSREFARSLMHESLKHEQEYWPSDVLAAGGDIGGDEMRHLGRRVRILVGPYAGQIGTLSEIYPSDGEYLQGVLVDLGGGRDVNVGANDIEFIEQRSKVLSEQVGQTIYQQLRGMDPMALMAWGAKDFVEFPAGHALVGIPGDHLGGLMFRVRGPKMMQGGKIIILLNGMDLYDVYAGRVRGADWSILGEAHDVYFDQLIQVIDGMVG